VEQSVIGIFDADVSMPAFELQDIMTIVKSQNVVNCNELS